MYTDYRPKLVVVSSLSLLCGCNLCSLLMSSASRKKNSIFQTDRHLWMLPAIRTAVIAATAWFIWLCRSAGRQGLDESSVSFVHCRPRRIAFVTLTLWPFILLWRSPEDATTPLISISDCTVRVVCRVQCDPHDALSSMFSTPRYTDYTIQRKWADFMSSLSYTGMGHSIISLCTDIVVGHS